MGTACSRLGIVWVRRSRDIPGLYADRNGDGVLHKNGEPPLPAEAPDLVEVFFVIGPRDCAENTVDLIAFPVLVLFFLAEMVLAFVGKDPRLVPICCA